MKKLFVLFYVLISLAVLAGCLPNQNHVPVITNTTPISPYSAEPNQVVTFSVTATDQDNDVLTYTWTCVGGSLATTNGTSVNWTAPASGNATVKVVVGDGKTTVNYTWTVNVGGAQSVVFVDEDINTPTTWTNDKIYVIDKHNFVVYNVLTINPGTIIKFMEDRYLEVAVGGCLKAQGTAINPIIFTSYRDDAHGNDTNDDGNLTTPSPTDWKGIDVKNVSGTIFSYCQFYYGGYYDTLYLDGVNCTITNCLFAHNGNNSSHYALNARSSLAGSVITNNTFYDNFRPLLINTQISVDDSNIFHNPNDLSQINKQNGIFIYSSNVETTISWGETEVPFVISETIYVHSDASLTLKDNVTVKFDTYGELFVDGMINANATQKILFTSFKDDAHGGDTNNDGSVSSPAAGNWSGVRLGNNSVGTFKNCEFYYGGSGNNSVVSTDGADIRVNIDNCIFAYNNGSNYGAVYFANANASSSITNSVFYGNVIPLMINADISIDNSNRFNNPANINEKNTKNGIFINDDNVNGAISWAETEVPFVISNGIGLRIPENNSLSLANNVIIKFGQYGYLTIGGSLTGYNSSGVIFTSLKDDTHGGDTNGDGSLTTPVDGDWEGIQEEKDGFWIDGNNILYAKYKGTF